MSPALKNGLLLAAVVLLFGGAVWFFRRGDPEARYSDDPATRTHWMCERCGKQIELTDKQRDEWTRSPDRVRRDPTKGGKQAVFWCDTCKAFSVVRAARCPIHNIWFVSYDSDGRPQDCPECVKAAGGR